MFTKGVLLRMFRLLVVLGILLSLAAIPTDVKAWPIKTRENNRLPNNSSIHSGNILALPVSITYLPILSQQNTSVPGLSGKVNLSGSPVAGVALDLRFYNGSAWSTAASTTTDTGGSYIFKNVPALSTGQKYYIRYINDSDASRLSSWYTRELLTYNASSTVVFGTFDIANIKLSTPAPGAVVPIPATFTWGTRPATPGDSYEFNLFDPADNNPYFYTDPLLGYTGSYTLQSLPPGFQKGVAYGWGIAVYSPDGGYGTSYYYYTVTFK